MEDSLENLTTSLAQLSEKLAPLLSQQSSLPLELADLSLLDRAKLNVVTAYSIHSLLFSTLRLQASSSADPSSFDIKSHPIMTELARIKQYFEKIEEAEKGRQGPRLRVDKGAAERFVRAGIKGLERENGSTPQVEMPVRSEDKKRKSEGEEENQGQESTKKKKNKKNKQDHSKKKSDKMPKGPREAFQALLNKPKSSQ